MQSFELYNPTRVIFGIGESKKIADHVKALGKKAMIVSYEENRFFEQLLTDTETALEK